MASGPAGQHSEEVRTIKTLLLAASARSLRFQLRDGTHIIASGIYSRLGTDGAYFEVTTDEEPYSESIEHKTHRQALRQLVDYFQRNGHIAALREIELVVHRIPHGGTLFKHTTVMDHAAAHRLEQVANLSTDMPAVIATLHASLRQLAGMNVGVFDTAFLSTIPAEAASYAVPPGMAKRFHLRRYGCRGVAHKAAHDSAMLLVRGRTRRPRRVVSVNIDDDVTVVALRDGVALDASCGFTAAEGLPGLHRSGSVDPRIPLHFATHLRATPRQADQILSTRCGIAGMTGKGSYAEILKAAQEGDVACVSALMLLSHRIAKEVAGMASVLGGIDMIIFSGNGASWMLCEEICCRLSAFKVRFAKAFVGKRGARGQAKGLSCLMSAPGSAVLVATVSIAEDEAALREASEIFRMRQRLKKSL